MSIFETAIMEMGRQREYKDFAPQEVVQWIFPQNWELFLDDLLAEVMELYRQDKILVTLEDKPVGKDHFPPKYDKVRIQVPKPFLKQKVG
jgi:hypothetical protein